MTGEITRPIDSTKATAKNPERLSRIHRRFENLLTAVLTRGYHGRVHVEVSIADGMIQIANVTHTETLK